MGLLSPSELGVSAQPAPPLSPLLFHQVNLGLTPVPHLGNAISLSDESGGKLLPKFQLFSW